MNNNIIHALGYVNPDCPRDEWVNILMAIKSELGDSGKAIASCWSSKGNSYKTADFNATWKSIKPSGGVTIATLFKIAKDNGFNPNYLEPIKQKSAEELARERQQAELQVQKEIEERLQKIANFWSMLKSNNPPQPCDNHPYLERKQIKPHGVHYLPNYKDNFVKSHGDNPLILWVMNNGKIGGFQLIYPDGFKRYIAGTVKQGGYYMVTRLNKQQTDKADAVVLCEGFATACSVIENKHPNLPTYISFDAGNLPLVAKYLRRLYPDKSLFIFADNDALNEYETGFNAGLTYARQALMEDSRDGEHTTRVFYPTFDEEDKHLTDWNDYYNILKARK